MTGKRFDWDVCDGDALFYEDGAVIDYDDVVDLLNTLNDENEELKQKVDFYKYFQKNARELEKENEKLKRLLEDDITRRCEIKEVCEERWGKLND